MQNYEFVSSAKLFRPLFWVLAIITNFGSCHLFKSPSGLPLFLMRFKTFFSFYHILAILLTTTISASGSASTVFAGTQSGNPDEYYQQNHLRYSDFIYQSDIQSVLLFREGWEMTRPVITLNSDEQLHLAFDDITGVLDNINATFVHCTSDWQPSDLGYPEFVDGLMEDFVVEYDYSRNTRQRYIHYDYVFPNENIKFTKSGNYLLLVYRNGDQEDLLLTRRFLVRENRVTVVPEIKPATNVDDRRYKQEVDFSIRHNSNYPLTNPYVDVKVVLLQNFRWDNAKTKMKPVFAKNNELIYDDDEINVFNGGNEFRPLDFKDIGYYTAQVARLERKGDENYIYLNTDKKRTFQVYLDQQDINGRRLITIDDRNTVGAVDADYGYVHFTLAYHELIPKGDLYVFGELSDWACRTKNKMVFNPEKQVYECTLFLKQGYYNYAYALIRDGEQEADLSFIEGSHSQTENEYTILVYHRSVTDDYERLVGVHTLKYPR